MANVRNGTYGAYYGSFFNESEPLPQDEMNENAKYIASYLTDNGWSKNAIAGMLGNMHAESTINPGRWQSEDVGNTSLGYGLVQWTPSTKYTDWCSEQGYSDPSEMDNALARILYELENNIQWIATSSYNFTFEEFSKSELSVSELAKAFLLNYERPADQSEEVQNYRASLGEQYYSVISGELPDPEPAKKKKRKFKFMLFTARKRMELWTRQNSTIE